LKIKDLPEMRFIPLLSALPIALGLMTGATLAKTAPVATQQIYDCTFVGGEVDWITDRLFIVRDLKTQEIKVFDAVIKHTFKDPIKATVVQDTATRLELDWQIANAPGVRSSATVKYHAIFLKGPMQIIEKAVVSGFDNKENRSGTCVVAK
jgi:hypothetical protein